MAKIDFPKKQEQRLIPKYLLEYAEELQEYHPDPTAEWGGGGGSPIEAGTGIVITGDETKTISVDTEDVAMVSSLSGVAFSGDYEDLTNKPTIPDDWYVMEIEYIMDYNYSMITTHWPKIYIKYQSRMYSPLSYNGIEYRFAWTDSYTDSQTNESTISNHVMICTAMNFTEEYVDLSNDYNDLINTPNVVTIDTNQTISGAKTFTQWLSVDGMGSSDDIRIYGGGRLSITNDDPMKNYALYMEANSLLYEDDNSHTVNINFITPTDDNTIAFPDKSGTLAVTYDIPTLVSELTNDSGFITSSSLNGYATEYWVGQQGYLTSITSTDVINALGYTPGTSNFSGNYNDLSNKPTIPTVSGTNDGTNWTSLTIDSNTYAIPSGGSTYTAGTGIDITGSTISVDTSVIAEISDIPTDTSDLTNGAGFITGINSSDVTTALGYTPVNPSSLATVATSGSYADLSNKPTIPTVNDNTITITQGGVTKGSFTLNQNTNQTINVDDVPGMIGEVIYNVTPTTGTTAYSINLSKDITQYDYIEVYFNDNDDTIRRFCSKFQEPAVGNKITLVTYLNNSTPRLYTKSTVYTIATTTSLALDSTVQQRISNNASTVVAYDTNAMHCRPYKIIGYKQNSAPIVIPTVATKTTLYSLGSGTWQGLTSISLSDNLDNYDYIDVIYGNSDYASQSYKLNNTTRLYKNDGINNTFNTRMFQVGLQGYMQTGAWYTKNAEYVLGTNTISTSSNGNQAQISYLPGNNPKVLPEWNGSAGQQWIYIMKVIGWKDPN